jgi:hypothetical protein
MCLLTVYPGTPLDFDNVQNLRPPNHITLQYTLFFNRQSQQDEGVVGRRARSQPSWRVMHRRCNDDG